jgi:hypothetical protein
MEYLARVVATSTKNRGKYTAEVIRSFCGPQAAPRTAFGIVSMFETRAALT